MAFTLSAAESCWLSRVLWYSFHLPSDIDPEIAADTFKEQRGALMGPLKNDLPNIANELYSKSIISADDLKDAMDDERDASVRTVTLLTVLETKIKAKQFVFIEVVKILEREPSFKSQASNLVKNYRHGMCPVILFLGSDNPQLKAIFSCFSSTLPIDFSKCIVYIDSWAGCGPFEKHNDTAKIQPGK